MQSFDRNKSISISLLIKGKSRDLQKLLKYFNSKKAGLFEGSFSEGGINFTTPYMLMSLAFLQQIKVKKSKKFAKIAKIE